MVSSALNWLLCPLSSFKCNVEGEFCVVFVKHWRFLVLFDAVFVGNVKIVIVATLWHFLKANICIEFPFSISWGILSSQSLGLSLQFQFVISFSLNPCFSLLRNQQSTSFPLWHYHLQQRLETKCPYTVNKHMFLVTNHRMSFIFTLELTTQVSLHPETLSMKHLLMNCPRVITWFKRMLCEECTVLFPSVNFTSTAMCICITFYLSHGDKLNVCWI